MFGIFKKNTKFNRLQKQYEKHMAEWKAIPSIEKAKFQKRYDKAKQLLDQMKLIHKNQNI